MSGAPICRVCNTAHWMRDPHVIKGALLEDVLQRQKRMNRHQPKLKAPPKKRKKAKRRR